jgi:hypothetical protein
VCALDNGEWDLDNELCIYDMFRTEDECYGAANGTYIFESCEELDISVCSTMLGLSAFAQERLQCYTNQWDVCETEVECLAAGDCNDWDFQNWHAPECWMNTMAAKSEQCTGVCVFPYNISTDGYPYCDWTTNAAGWSRKGCINYSIISSESCASAGGSWTVRAFDAASCAAHGQGCEESRYWQLSPKAEETCATCGGTPRDLYQWSPGAWTTGTMVPLQWKAREFASINRWQPTLNWTKLHAQVESVAVEMMARAEKSALMCRFNLVADTLKQIACLCTDTDNVCSNATGTEAVAVGEQAFFSGIKSESEWLGATVRVSETSVPADTDVALVTAALIPTATTEALVARKRKTLQRKVSERGPYDPNEYEVVTNHVDYIVGQLLSDGVTINVPANVTIELCININPAIPRDPEEIYPVPDFAGYQTEPTEKWWPLELNVTIVGNYTQFCADISESGTYFAILRAEPWEFITGGLGPAPTAGPTPSPTVTPTVAPTASPVMPVTTTDAATVIPTTLAPTVAPVGSLSTVGIVLISLGGTSLLIMVLIILCLACRRRRRRRRRDDDREYRPVGKQVRQRQRYAPLNTQPRGRKYGIKAV